jgi:hypothetical protein
MKPQDEIKKNVLEKVNRKRQERTTKQIMNIPTQNTRPVGIETVYLFIRYPPHWVCVTIPRYGGVGDFHIYGALLQVDKHKTYLQLKSGKIIEVFTQEITGIRLAKYPDNYVMEEDDFFQFLDKLVKVTTKTKVYEGYVRHMNRGWIALKTKDINYMAIKKEDIKDLKEVSPGG